MPQEHFHPLVIRNIDSQDYFENFFVFSVLSIVVIRIFLELTNYPMLAGWGLHIAHMLWGGLFMMIALLINFFYLNKGLFQVASVLAGIGFGTFIDELGKYMTADNDYFYEPTFALIYVIFVILYLTFRWTRNRWVYSKEEYLANAMEATKEALIHDFDLEEKRQAIAWLKRADQEHPLTRMLQQLLKQQKLVKKRSPWYIVIRELILDSYRYLVDKRWVRFAAVTFFVFEVIGYAVLVTLLLVNRTRIHGVLVDVRLNFFGWGLVISSLAAILLLAVGLFYLVRERWRQRAYRLFRYSLLVNILLVTFFAFYFNEVLTLINLTINIVFLKAFEYVQIQEKKIQVTA